MKLAVQAAPRHASIIKELLSPWEISWVSTEKADAVILYGQNASSNSPRTILIPVHKNFSNQALKTAKLNKPFEVHASTNIELLTSADTAYTTEKELNDRSLGSPVLFDIVCEYEKLIQRVMNPRSAGFYNLATLFPLPYNKVPKRIRDSLMRKKEEQEYPKLASVLNLDALRFSLLKSIQELVGGKLLPKTWRGKASVCLFTHDIDTRDGLENALKVKKLEEKYDFPSAWFIPSKQYALDNEVLKNLASHGEVGSHDTKHDGRLIHLSQKGITKRLEQSKSQLESASSSSVVGFRAPLLQHSPDILRSLRLAGYVYDSSIPTWEANHPRTMSPHGIGTVYPTVIDDTLEIPITVMQDHQFLYVLKMKPQDVLDEWLTAMNLIRELGGCCVFLSHPEYEMLKNDGLKLYEQLLNIVAAQEDMLVTVPADISSQKATEDSITNSA